ncbi:MAG: MCE family protein [Marmoricola sp.]
MIKPLTSRSPFTLGVVTIVVGALVALGVVGLSRAHFGKGVYTAVLAQSAGLKPKEEVQVHGVRVGEVRSVALVGHTVHVSFTVSSDIHLGSRSTAAVQVATLLGTHQLLVTPRGGGDLARDTIPLGRTTVPFNLQDVMDQGTEKVEQLDGKRLARMLTTMTDQLSPAGKHLGPALKGVIRFSQVVSHRSGQLGGLLRAARHVTTQLSASSTDLVTLMKQTNLVVREVTRRRQAIHTLLTQATRLSHNLTAVIHDTRADVHPALQALNGALAELRAQDAALRRVFDAMAPAVRYVANATGNAPYIDLYAHPPALPPNDTHCNLEGQC